MSSLSEQFGIKFNEFSNPGKAALIKFAASYPDHVDVGRTHVSFETYGHTFVIEHDMTQEFEVCFKLKILAYGPTEILYDTGWQSSIPEVLRMSQDDPKFKKLAREYFVWNSK